MSVVGPINKVTCKAPSSTANLGPGFDVFGLALDAFYDEVTISRIKRTGKGIVTITHTQNDNASLVPLPTTPEENTAGLAAIQLMKAYNITDDIKITIRKGVPAGFGMGSSAASAAATVTAFNNMYGLNLEMDTMVEFAGAGEKASAGSIHYDNVAASILGGFVIVRTDPLDVIKVEAPSNLKMCVAVPALDIPKKKTQVARSVIPKEINMTDSVANISNAVAIAVGFMNKDTRLLGESIKDVIVEPARKHMIPGFDAVKENALKAGAFGVTISGAGPSVIAFADDTVNMEQVSKAMRDGFQSADIKCQTIVCGSAKGATIQEETKL